MMEKMTIKPNVDNDLKYLQGIDELNKKTDEEEFAENANGDGETKLEYFTE